MRAVRRRFDAMMDRRAAAIPRAALTLDQRLELVRRHGDFSLAYSTAVQDGLDRFGDEGGYLAFGTKMGSVIALGDPVAPKARHAALLADFIAAAGRPCFAEIGPKTAAILAGLGYRIAHMGVDTVLDLATYDFSGKRKETVRYSERWLEKHGYRMVEEHELEDAAAAVEELSRRWRASRIVRRREMAFLNRPFPTAPDPAQRRFLLVDPQGDVVSLLYFDPIHRDGAIVGYLTAFKRKLPDATNHAEIGLTKRAVDTFGREGREMVTLGLSPLAGAAPSGHPESAAFRWAMGRLYESSLVNGRIFNLKGHAALKRRFHGREEPRYFAWGRGSPFVHFLSLLRLSKAF